MFGEGDLNWSLKHRCGRIDITVMLIRPHLCFKLYLLPFLERLSQEETINNKISVLLFKCKCK